MTDLMTRLAPVERKKSLLPDLTTQSELALLCRALLREGYNDHIAAHISCKHSGSSAMTDGNGFPFLWEAEARRELRARPEVLASLPGLPNA